MCAACVFVDVIGDTLEGELDLFPCQNRDIPPKTRVWVPVLLPDGPAVVPSAEVGARTLGRVTYRWPWGGLLQMIGLGRRLHEGRDHGSNFKS